ncbi:MAG: hypothetical protein CL917_12905 [Deltaproteobacteria bacterium]|nr:hypothetical protein [Deltaproteobacteria bacterium]
MCWDPDPNVSRNGVQISAVTGLKALRGIFCPRELLRYDARRTESSKNSLKSRITQISKSKIKFDFRGGPN